MPSLLATRGSVIVDDVLQSSAGAATATETDEELVALEFTTSSGRRIALDPAVVDLVAGVLARLAAGDDVSIHAFPNILTTSAAAELLGVSRPTVMKFIRSGQLESTMVGTHHRLRLAEVRAFRQKREQSRRMAVEQLLKLDEDDSL